MKNLFSPENPLMQFLSRVGDMILANLLFLVCCIPVVTIGASLTALNRVTQSIALREDGGVVKPFFRSFSENFRQATPVWVILLIFFICMGLNLLLAASYLTGKLLLLCKWALGMLTVWVLAVACYYFHLLARYENTVRQHLTNAMILAVVKLPRTVGLAVLALLPVLLAYLSMEVFVSTLVFWLLLGFAFSSYLSAALLAPVFRQMEPKGNAGVQLFD